MAVREIPFDDFIFHTGKSDEFIDFIFNKAKENSDYKVMVVHINLRNYYYFQKDIKLKEQLKKYILIFEGIGLKIAFMLKGYGLLPDLNGTDLFPLIMQKIPGNSRRVFLLGSEQSVIETAARNISDKYPLVNICGYHNGYFPEGEEERIVKKINDTKPFILFLGMGFPRQEKFAVRNLEKLEVPLIWNVGGLFDFLSRKKLRAPLLIRKMRLEWFYRFIKEPRRMFHRNSVAAFWSLKDIIKKKKN